MSSDKLSCFLDEKLRRVDAFELEEPQSVHDLLLLNTLYRHQERGAPVPRSSGAHGRVALRDLALRHWLLRGDNMNQQQINDSFNIQHSMPSM